MATYSSILAWRIPWTEEPGGLQSTGSQRVGHNWVTSLFSRYRWADSLFSFFLSFFFFFFFEWTMRKIPLKVLLAFLLCQHSLVPFTQAICKEYYQHQIQHQIYQIYWKYQFLGPIPNLVMGEGLSIYILLNFLDLSDIWHSLRTSVFFFLISYWSRFDLQFCISFMCIAEWIGYMHAYIHFFFFFF